MPKMPNSGEFISGFFGLFKKLPSTEDEGFTLVELAIVIAIIGILVAIVITAINPVKMIKNAHDTKRKEDIAAIATALHNYAVDHNDVYPRETGCDSSVGRQGQECDWTGGVGKNPPQTNDGSNWAYCDSVHESCGGSSNYIFGQLVPNYIKALPVDPINNTQYFYAYEPRNETAADDPDGDIKSCNNNLSSPDKGYCTSFVIGAHLEVDPNTSFVCASDAYSSGGGYKPNCSVRNSLQLP